MIHTAETEFFVGGTRCAAWLTLPDGDGPHPAVVLVHGLGATHQMMLGQYEQHFAAQGIAVLAFDYRHTGASDGHPRQRISMRRQRADVHVALDTARYHPAIDAKRIALWGTSLGGMHVIRVASERADVAAAVIQCPIVYGPGAGLSSGLGHVAKLTPAIARDMIRFSLGLPRRYIRIVGEPGETAVVVSPGALDGWNTTVSPGGSFINAIAAANALGLVAATATRHARNVQAPLLVCVSDNEGLMDPKYVEVVARRAPKGVEKHYPADHFEVYHLPVLKNILRDQTDFLLEHLHV
jgi:pimeloyl-ACP methyl ester carboxylesterase